MKIQTIIENLVYQRGLLAEQGLSFFIENGPRKILFDTGQSIAFLQNARKLGIDISKIDTVILSHGHFDHTGGLLDFLQINKTAKIYAKKEVFQEKYKTGRGFIGSSGDLKKYHRRFSFIDHLTEIDQGLFILPDIQIYNPVDTSFADFSIRIGNDFIPDDFRDELFLVFIKNEKLTILTSCSHRGITNILQTAINHFKLKIHLILGGFHLKDSGMEKYSTIADYLKSVNPENIGTCHCTGIDFYYNLKSIFGNGLFYNETGNTVEI